MYKIGFLGGGTMAEAILNGIMSHNAIMSGPSSIMVAEISASRRDSLRSSYPTVAVTESVEDMLKICEMIILAVKPYQLPQIIHETASYWEGKAVVSILAGWNYTKLANLLPKSRLLRVMPNTAAKVSAAMSALASEYTLTSEEYSLAKQIFESCGEVVELSETQFDAVTAISGSGPAYVYMFIDAMTQGGVLHGLPKAVARKMAVQTVLGAAEMVRVTDKSPNDLKDDVCTPGGTTIEAVYALENNRFSATVIDAVTACFEKSRRM